MKHQPAALVAAATLLFPALAPAQGAPRPELPSIPSSTALFPVDHPRLDSRSRHDERTSEFLDFLPLPLPDYGPWVGVTKWLTLGTAAGLGALGFSLHADANDTFAELERACEADADNCRSRAPDGSYSDPRLESLYQNVLDKDAQARLSLIGAQLSFGVSVLLFIVDFQKDEGPGDIPYDPDDEQSRFQLSAVPGEVTLRYYFR